MLPRAREIARRRRPAPMLVVAGVVVGLLAGHWGARPPRALALRSVEARGTPIATIGTPPPTAADEEWIHWLPSRAVGRPFHGRLIDGVRLPSEGEHFFSWDPVRARSPNRPERRYGTDRLLRFLLATLGDYAIEHPDAGRIGVGDLSHPHGGPFGRRYGGLGHASHQNGLDVDVYYPRRDGLQRPPRTFAEADPRLSQALVDAFVAAGAQLVFVGPHTGLTGPRSIVSVLPYHDNHVHVRIPPAP